MTLRNLRAYTQDKDDTLSTVTPSDYETGKGANARLRKINLNVDLATQAELNEAFNLLSNAIQDISTGTLSNYYTKPEANEISTALSNAAAADIETEATAREEADNAIKASLSAYALSTTVADAYKVAVSDAAEQTSSFVYTITQGELTAGTINVPKDMFVEGASFQGTVLVLSVRGQDTPISTDLSGLVDEYTGSDNSEVKVTTDGNVISVVLKDTIARVGTSEDASSANTVYGAKKYADEVAAAVAVSAEGETGDGALVSADDVDNMITVGSTKKLQDAVNAAEHAVTYVTTANDLTGDNILITVSGKTELTAAAGEVYVGASDRLKQVVNKVEAASADWDSAEADAKAYTDTVSAALSTAVNTEIGAEKTRAEGVEQALSTAIDNLSSSLNAAEGDEYISAYVDGNTVKVEALCATVWNEVSAKADLTAVDGLSAIYKTIAKVNNAVSSTRFDLPITDDYEDIDDIIADVIEIRKALNMLRETNSPAPVTGNFIKLAFDYSDWDADVGGHHVAEAIYSVDDNHNIVENISVTKGCQEDSIQYLGNNEVKYILYNVNEGYEDESQSYIIEYNSEYDEYDAAWGEGNSTLAQPTVTKLTSV